MGAKTIVCCVYWVGIFLLYVFLISMYVGLIFYDILVILDLELFLSGETRVGSH